MSTDEPEPEDLSEMETAGASMEETTDDSDGDEPKQHDLVLKTVLHHFFGDLLELTEPDFASRVDLSNIEFLEQETFSDFPKGTHRRADLVAKLSSRIGEGRIVLVQTEVEGEFRSAMDECVPGRPSGATASIIISTCAANSDCPCC